MGFLAPDTPAATPAPPPPPPPPPAAHPATAASGAVQSSADQQRRRAQAAAGQGFSDTLKTSPTGTAAPSTAKATLLGDTEK